MRLRATLAALLPVIVFAAALQAASPNDAPPLSEVRSKNLQVTMLDGTVVPLNDLLIAGHPVVIEFWATWCAPCRKTMPELRKLHERYGSKGLVVLGLTVEDPAEDLEKVKTFIEKEKVPYRIAFASDDVFKAITQRSKVGVPKILVYDFKGAVQRYEVTYSPFTNGRVARAVETAMSGLR